jgi:type IV pilus assembly protein PilA
VLTLKGLARRRGDDEEGFTLIELMVVVLIIAILIAIAIPTFLGARQRAQDRAAQSDLRNGLTTEKTIYTDNQLYTSDTTAAGALNTNESSLNWADKRGNGRGLNAVVLWNGAAPVPAPANSGDTVCLSEKSASGTWFGLADVAVNGTVPAGTYFKNNGTTGDPCAGVAANAFTGWASSF